MNNARAVAVVIAALTVASAIPAHAQQKEPIAGTVYVEGAFRPTIALTVATVDRSGGLGSGVGGTVGVFVSEHSSVGVDVSFASLSGSIRNARGVDLRARASYNEEVVLGFVHERIPAGSVSVDFLLGVGAARVAKSLTRIRRTFDHRTTSEPDQTFSSVRLAGTAGIAAAKPVTRRLAVIYSFRLDVVARNRDPRSFSLETGMSAFALQFGVGIRWSRRTHAATQAFVNPTSRGISARGTRG
jgi:hypothetical protein